MSSMNSLNVPVFAGQGVLATNTHSVSEQALHDAQTPSGSVLVSSCYDAFREDILSLPVLMQERLGLRLSDYDSPLTLLSVPSGTYKHNAVISGTRLFLIQTLRYLTVVEASGLAGDHANPFVNTLKRNSEHGVGVLGFSSGILAATVVASSTSRIAFISNAVQVFRVALWIGVHGQLYREGALNEHPSFDQALPWSLVFIGLNEESAYHEINEFNKTHPDLHPLFVTAIIDANSVTISSRPDVLALFAAVPPPNCIIHQTILCTLYHSPLHPCDLRKEVMKSLEGRSIHFPQYHDLQVPLRSSFTGDVIKEGIESVTLLETILDMLLIHPVRWNLVAERFFRSCPVDEIPCLLNFGPGNGLSRALQKAFPPMRISTTDFTIHTPLPEAEVHPPLVPHIQEPVAIVGMAINMPNAPNTSKLWEVLMQGMNTISKIPSDRFVVEDYVNPNNPNNPNSGRTMKTCNGNFIDNAGDFDHMFFTISPREAKTMDPQQRILLHCSYEALENAGYVPNSTPSFQEHSFGCYIGAATHDYVQNLRNDIDVYYSTGTLASFLSGRVSYAMRLGGPSIVTDTACSSSMTALYLACRGLMNGDCTAALAGGVNVITSPENYLGLDRGHFLSPTGQCKAFDASADGYARSEGCGIFVLKRLTDALAENDNVLGVIRGIEINQNGFAHSITRPHVPTQAALLRRVLEKSGFSADRINVVEAHGTGTQAGDPNELESLRAVLNVDRRADNPLYVTSIKANIGHLEAASGAAGLAKLLLMFRHRVIPRQISLHNLNPKIAPLHKDNTVINTANAAWLPSHKSTARAALLNNFGAAGSNGALVVEEYLSGPPASPPCVNVCFGLSAKTGAALEELRSRYLEWVQSPSSEDIALCNIAYTATARRQIYNHRLAVTAKDRTELIEKLRSATPVIANDKQGHVVFVFSGQGGQYVGMGAALYDSLLTFRRCVDDCHKRLIEAGFPGVTGIITGVCEGAIEELQACQEAVFVVEYALAKVWMSWGVFPFAVIGHRLVTSSNCLYDVSSFTDSYIIYSLGEYTALVIAGVLALQDALLIVARRAQLMVQLCGLEQTGMLAVSMPACQVSRLLETFSGLSIACFNSPTDCVVAGPLPQLDNLDKLLTVTVRCKTVRLAVPLAYHSVAMAPLCKPFTDSVQGILVNAPKIPVVSNVHGRVVCPGDTSVFNAEYFAAHCVQPVLFERGMQSLVNMTDFECVSAFLELGPHPTSLPMIKSNDAISCQRLLVASLRRQQDAWVTLTDTLCQLYLDNVQVLWREVYGHLPQSLCVDLPSYPFAKTRFWTEFKEEQPSGPALHTGGSSDNTGHPLLKLWIQRPCPSNQGTAIFATTVGDLSQLISGHVVGGVALCPGSVYMELAYGGANLHRRSTNTALDEEYILLDSVEFCHPLVDNGNCFGVVETTIKFDADGRGIFTVDSLSDTGTKKRTTHCRGQLRYQSIIHVKNKFARRFPILKRQMAAVLTAKNGQIPETFSTHTIYEIIFPRIVVYSKAYWSMQSITVDVGSMDGCSSVRMPKDLPKNAFIVNPVFTDTMIHVAGFVANLQGAGDDVYMCCGVESAKIVPSLVHHDADYVVYCSLAGLPEGLINCEVYVAEAAECGKIIAHMEGIQFRQIRLASLKRHLTLASDLVAPVSTRALKQINTNIKKLAPPIISPLSNNFTEDYIYSEVIKIVSDACNADRVFVDVHLDLSYLGVDSLMTIEICASLRRSFSHLDLDMDALLCCRTISEIASEVFFKAVRDSSGPSSPTTLIMEDISLQSPGTRPTDVRLILASILEVDPAQISDDVPLDVYGLDSLTSIEALHTLESEYDLNLSPNFLVDHPTLREINEYIILRECPGSVESDGNYVKDVCVFSESSTVARALHLHSNPFSFQMVKTVGQSSLFMIHDGSGLVNYYERLGPLGRDLWGIWNPYFLSCGSWQSLEAAASAYADDIHQSACGPVIIGGWSFGGVAAFAAARLLLQRGVDVKGVVLIDSPSPVDHVPLDGALLDSVAHLNENSTRPGIRNLLKAQFRLNSALLGRYDPRSGEGVYPKLVLLRSREAFDVPGIPDVPSWLSDRSDYRQALTGWECLVGCPVKTWDIPGNHFEPFKQEHVAEVTARIIDACAYLEAASPCLGN